MTRRCSHCSNNGHNACTCPARSAAATGGVKLFGMRLTTAPTPAVMKKSASMSCIASSFGGGGTSPPAARGGGGGGGADGYVSDDPAHASCSTNGRAERKKGTPWTEEKHRMFLMGLQKLGKGDWRGISQNFVVSKTPTQVTSHAQKYFIRQTNSSRRKTHGPRNEGFSIDFQVSRDDNILSSWFSGVRTQDVTGHSIETKGWGLFQRERHQWNR